MLEFRLSNSSKTRALGCQYRRAAGLVISAYERQQIVD